LIGSPAVARAAIIQVILLILLLLLDAAPGRLWSRSLIEHRRDHWMGVYNCPPNTPANIVMAALLPLHGINSEEARAQFLKCAFTQMRIALARLGKFDDALGDDSVGEIVFKPKRYAGHFERDTQKPLGLGIDIEVV
jgi:hypothetical protein